MLLPENLGNEILEAWPVEHLFQELSLLPIPGRSDMNDAEADLLMLFGQRLCLMVCEAPLAVGHMVASDAVSRNLMAQSTPLVSDRMIYIRLT